MKLRKLSIIEIINIGKLVHCGGNIPSGLENTYLYCGKETAKSKVYHGTFYKNANDCPIRIISSKFWRVSITLNKHDTIEIHHLYN